MKKFNNSTGCYKIDVYVDGGYFWSTDWSKTCRDAKEKAIRHLNEHNITFEKVSAHFANI